MRSAWRRIDFNGIPQHALDGGPRRQFVAQGACRWAYRSGRIALDVYADIYSAPGAMRADGILSGLPADDRPALGGWGAMERGRLRSVRMANVRDLAVLEADQCLRIRPRIRLKRSCGDSSPVAQRLQTHTTPCAATGTRSRTSGGTFSRSTSTFPCLQPFRRRWDDRRAGSGQGRAWCSSCGLAGEPLSSEPSRLHQVAERRLDFGPATDARPFRAMPSSWTWPGCRSAHGSSSTRRGLCDYRTGANPRRLSRGVP